MLPSSLDLNTWDTLDRYTRMYAYVGAYFYKWSIMELSLDRAIGKALDLNNLQGVALCANIQFSAKCHLLKTIINLGNLTKETREEYTRILNKIAKAATQRNTVAHDSFYPSDDGKAVHFFVVRAKGVLDVPSVIWRRRDFEVRYERLDWFSRKLQELPLLINTAAITKALMNRPSALQQLAAVYEPTKGQNLLSVLGRPTLPPQVHQTSDTTSANSQANPQTPEESQKSE